MIEHIDAERLARHLEVLGSIGQEADGGITRPFGSVADEEARRWFENTAKQAGLVYRVDPAGNQWASLPGAANARTIAVGSHLDSVPHGGRYDGAAGVVLALEALQTLRQKGYSPQHTLAVVAFTGEEPNPFGLSTLGSRLLTGRLDPRALEDVTDPAGRRLDEALRRVGGDLTRCNTLNPAFLAAFIEPHIEQSGRLDDANRPLGVVNRITGIYRDRVRIIGEQNHAGTTHPRDRRDALLAFGEAVGVFERLMDTEEPWVVGTIGHAEIYPNAVNIVPSRVEYVAELRSVDLFRLKTRAMSYREQLERLAAHRRITVEIENLLDQPPRDLHPAIRRLLEEALDRRQVPVMTLPSLAGHDATHLAAWVPTGMLFIRSLGGKSHCPEEASRLDDLALAADVLMEVWPVLDHEMRRNPHGYTL
ncbi:MAG: Zn-dependent hydrolase [Sulfobacillus sp.]|nr:Zn-dependent hydrolase [Sulfobacillus sp.]